jgi:hypothetical protein
MPMKNSNDTIENPSNDIVMQVNMEVPFLLQYTMMGHSVIFSDVSVYLSGYMFYDRNLKGGNP